MSKRYRHNSQVANFMYKILIFLACLFSIIGICNASWYSQTSGIMGTNIYAEVWHDDPAIAEKALTEIMAEMERINQLMSSYIDTSELSKINQKAAENPIAISDEMFDLLTLSLHFSNLTDGAFDITYASIGYLYNYKQAKRPDEPQISALLDAVNYKHVLLDKENKTVFFDHPNVKIDLGGIAKGYAVDNAIKIVKAMGIEHALITAGGDTKLLGDRRGKPWIVGIRDPRNRDKQAVVVPLYDTAMSTSGDYERYFEEDGIRYHHILSPKTGKSTHSVQSVSIIGPSSVYNDALSTAVFVMGLADGLGFINSLPDFDAIVMDAERKMHYSNGLQN
ncbi:MAG: FAD:protein FMN transferase [Pseudomonadota bacterium]